MSRFEDLHTVAAVDPAGLHVSLGCGGRRTFAGYRSWRGGLDNNDLRFTLAAHGNDPRALQRSRDGTLSLHARRAARLSARATHGLRRREGKIGYTQYRNGCQ